MKNYILLLIFCVILSIVTLPLSASTDESIKVKEIDQLKIQVQLLMAENASLKQQLASKNQDEVSKASSVLLSDLYKTYNLDPTLYDLHIDTMTFTPKLNKDKDAPQTPSIPSPSSSSK